MLLHAITGDVGVLGLLNIARSPTPREQQNGLAATRRQQLALAAGQLVWHRTSAVQGRTLRRHTLKSRSRARDLTSRHRPGNV